MCGNLEIIHKKSLKLKLKVNYIIMKNINVKSYNSNDFNGKIIEINTNQENEKNNLIIKLITGAIIGFVNGFWGGGGGMICVPVLTYLLKVPEKVAHATTILIILPLTISSLIIYFLKTNIDLIITSWVGIGFVLGGIIGALILKKINNVILKIIFNIIIIAGGVRLLF